jgi:phosphatidylserine/phosphatidylglycerophosphate/cardiolipin synthase-like enzyme
MSAGAALAMLGEADLRALAAAIRSRRLGPPFGMTAVQRITGASTAAAVSEALVCLSLEGCSQEALASCLEMLADSAAVRPSVEEHVQLVMTGPEGVACHRDTAVVVEDLFRRAETSILVAGYAVYQGKQVFQELGRRMEELPDLQVRVFLNVARKREDVGTTAQIVAVFVQRFALYNWPAECRLPELYYDGRSLATTADNPIALHAKCVVIDEREVFISSANFSEAAQHRNIEVGVLVKSVTLARQATEFFNGMVRDGICLRAA